MNGKPADFVLQVDGVQTVTLVLGRAHVDFKAALLELTDGNSHAVCPDGNMAVFTEILCLHDFDARAGEVGGIARLHGEVESFLEGFGDTHGSVGHC